MTKNKNKKKLVRARIAETGESYQAAHHAVSASRGAKGTSPGSTIAQRFRIVREVPIATTSIGGEPISHAPWMFYEAKHVLLGGDVKITLLPSAAARKQPILRAWLLRQGRALQRVAHPQVVKVFDIGETDAEEVYLVLEQPSGITLSARLEEKGADEAFARDVVRQTAALLAHLHDRGVVHRGLRNGAIHVDERGDAVTVRLTHLEFPTLAGDPQLPLPEGLVGNCPWASPELSRGDVVDARSDLYSLGVILYTMLTGRLPAGDDGRALSSSLAPICVRLLAGDPSARYVSAHALVDALLRA